MGDALTRRWTVIRQPLGPGRLLLEYGPLHAVIWTVPAEFTAVAAAAALHALEHVAAHRVLVRRFIGEILPAGDLPPVVAAMIAATRVLKEPEATPMICVAGAIADAATDAAAAAGAAVVTVNNGGDIALRLAPGRQIRVGLHSGLDAGAIAGTLTVTAADGIGGICTSGLGGRSLTRGIASAVTVLAPRAIAADAAASLVANQTYVPYPGIEQAPARAVDPDSDLRDLAVTVRVPPDLPDSVREEALRRGALEAERLGRTIHGAVLFVGSRRRLAGNVREEAIQWLK